MGDDVRAKQALGVLASRWPREPVLSGTMVELQLDGGARMVTEALGLLDEADLVPATLALREPSLDDVFLALTGHGATVDAEGFDAAGVGAGGGGGATDQDDGRAGRRASRSRAKERS
jgi:hypothetical protein